jgi:predicted AAA+ superfamily ATPase
LDDQLIEQVLRGGFPEALTRTTARRRKAWGTQYLDALIKRDVRDIASIDKLAQLPRFLRALAQTAGQMCNYTKLGGEVGLDGKTVAKYIGVFEQMYLLKRLDMWSRNHLNRIVKTPKLQFLDAGLLATVLDMQMTEVQKDKSRFGHVLETYVYGELLKHVQTANSDYRLMSYRDTDQVEVDFVVENTAGELICIEVKASATVSESDLKGLKKLASLAGDQFKMGVVLYNGEETLPLGPHLWATPLSSLWGQ